jgi:hypothetical protein
LVIRLVEQVIVRAPVTMSVWVVTIATSAFPLVYVTALYGLELLCSLLELEITLTMRSDLTRLYRKAINNGGSMDEPHKHTHSVIWRRR